MKQYRNEIFSFLMLMAGVLRHGLHCLMSVLSGFWRQSRRLAFLSWLKHGSI